MIFISNLLGAVTNHEELTFFDLWDSNGDPFKGTHPVNSLNLSLLFPFDGVTERMSVNHVEQEVRSQITSVSKKGGRQISFGINGTSQAFSAMANNLLGAAIYLIETGVNRGSFGKEFSSFEVDILIETLGLTPLDQEGKVVKLNLVYDHILGN